MTRSNPSPTGTLLHGLPLASGNATSMKVRLQLTLHQRQVVCSLVVVE